MNILLLGPFDVRLDVFFREKCCVRWENGEFGTWKTRLDWQDLTLSYRYRYILSATALSCFHGRPILNLHTSLLPWNRGAHPNFWSWADGTPKGVTLHHIEAGIDTGQILIQEEIKMGLNETLRTSYERLDAVAVDLLINFYSLWTLRLQEGISFPQLGAGNYHKASELQKYWLLLKQGWDTPVSQIPDIVGETQMSIDLASREADEICGIAI